MTNEKKIGSKLTNEQLGMDPQLLEKRAVANKGTQKKQNNQQQKKKETGDPAKNKQQKPQQNAGKQKQKQAKPAANAAKGTQQKQQPAANKNTSNKNTSAKKTQGSGRPQSPNRGAAAPKRKQKQSLASVAANQLQKAIAASNTALKQAEGSRKKKPSGKKTPVRIIPLGGLNEVGKNVTLYECMNDMFMIDCGMTFPDDQMLGVDLVLPDFGYALKNKDRLRGIVITHGHEDHIGALPYFLKNCNVPVYATRLTIGLIENKLEEHGLLGKVKLIHISPRETIKLGCMEVEFIRVNHSIPDAVALAVHTPAGIIVHTGDFKIDYTPIVGDVIDLARFGELGSRGVLALLSDSTNAERPGFTPTEQTVAESFDKLFKQARHKRIIIATFSSNIHRVQLICEAAGKYNRKVAFSGRSMENVVGTAIELGFLQPPADVVINIDDIDNYPREQVVLITTGSQGEPMSALSRMATNDHRKVTVSPEDFIIISATPIPGNEKTVSRVVNDLMLLGADVIYERMYDVHVSGHACQEELKMMLALTRPKFFFPVHGEYKQLKRHASLALAMGIPRENVIIAENGRVVEFDGVSVKMDQTVPVGRVLVDGLGVGDVGSIVLRDRKHLGQDGLIVVVTVIRKETGEILSGPDIISRGFVYVRESEDMISGACKVAQQAINACIKNNTREWGNIKNQVRDALSSYFYSRTKRSPMILPVIQEV